MKTVDWIVVGGGLAGSALGYELTRVGFSVLLVEQHPTLQGATRYSYGGIAYWSGHTDLTRQLCLEGIEIHRQLSAELEHDTQFRELDLLLTIAPDEDPTAIAATYTSCLIPPALISAETACEMEPLLHKGAIAAALHVKHGHVDPERTVQAYQQAMVHLGGTIKIAPVVSILKTGDCIKGVVTPDETLTAAHVVICAGGLSRALLQANGIPVRCYFTHAEIVETPPLDLHLKTCVSPANLKRFPLEAEAGQATCDRLWEEPGHEIAPAVLDAGVFQFMDGRLRMGQISRVLTDPDALVDAVASETTIRDGVNYLLPVLKDVPGQWHHCLVAFSGDNLPLVGALPSLEGLYVFSGFSNPFAILPPLARRFARSFNGEGDRLLPLLAPNRFSLHSSDNNS
jgi:glycine/D-amino acid oxidase-like deaminating enzyme